MKNLSNHSPCCPHSIFNGNYIDTHAHLWPDEYLDELEHLGSTSVAVAKNIGASDKHSDLTKRLDMMNKAGVRYQLLSATPQVPQWGSPSDAEKLSQIINNVYYNLIEKYPKRFIAYGTVPLPYVDEAIKEARRCILDFGFKGIAINTLINDKISIADERFYPFYEELNRLGTILYIHPTGCGANSPMINDYNLEWVIGAPIEDTLATLQLLKADIPYKYPNIRFHVAHLGGVIPYMMQRIEDNFSDWSAFKRSPYKELKRFYFDTANFHAPSLKCMIETFGSEHLLLGSDFPYFQNDKYTRAVTYIKEAGLSDEVIESILVNNAWKLLNLK